MNVTEKPTRVLVVDDSPLVLSMLEDTLTTAGFEVATAADGSQGLSLAQRFEPQVVLCDLNMPGMSGIEVVEQMRMSAPLTPILIFTEAAELSSAVKAMQRGAFGYLSKGLPDEALIEELNKAVAHRQVLERNRELEEANRRYQHGLETMVAEKTAEIAKLQEVKAQTEKMAAMGSFVAGVAHEINSPLAVVRANTDWMVEELLPALKAGAPQVSEEASQVLHEVGTCALRIQRIVEGLRRFSHTGTGPAACELVPAIEEAKLMCRGRIDAAVNVHWLLDPTIKSVALSQDDLVLVITNLVVNSAHALESVDGREGLVTVSVVPAGSWVQVTVEDNGCGIPKDQVSRVCDPFFTTKAPGKGTGLGLSLVHQVVKNARGELSIDSEVNRGTKVTLRLLSEPPSAPPTRR